MNKYSHIYFVGIGGIGMSALARYYNANGVSVAGYDKVRTKLTEQLEKEGMHISYSDEIATIPEEFKSTSNTRVVYTPAIPTDSITLNYFKENGFLINKRSEELGRITEVLPSIAIAGTHGKTTTSCIMAHVLITSGLPINAFLGGIATNYESNLVINTAAEWNVMEADEYDRSFLRLNPEIPVITSADPDHLDIYGNEDEFLNTFRQFYQQKKGSYQGVCQEHVAKKLGITDAITYGFSLDADVYAFDVRVVDGMFTFSINDRGQLHKDVQLGLPGRHNIENALATYCVARQLDISADSIAEAFATFNGVKRRFEVQVKRDDFVYIDDYAHHPSELKACINATRELFPGKRLTGVFQPHLYSRTRDFADEFAAELGNLEELILLDIYPARELPIEGVTSAWLLSKVKGSEKEVVGKEELISCLKEKHPEVLLTLGAGDIDQLVEPIKNAFVA